jgi:FkbH-like protein
METQDDALLVWVVFLEDILPWQAFLQEGASATAAADAALSRALEALDQRLGSSDRPTIVAWLGWYPESPVRRARRPTARDAAAAHFASELRHRAASSPNLYLLSLDALFAAEGMHRCLDARNFYATRCRPSLAGLQTLARALRTLVARITHPACKVLVLDGDNTLWGGVIGEAGLGGIELGQEGLGHAFVAFQQSARVLAGNGTILAMSSKNDEADVWSVFDQHPSMVLRRDDLAAFRIDWREKSAHLQEIAADLNVGLDSLVFWDDNPVEREKIRAELPMITVPELPPDVADWPSALLSLDALSQVSSSADDLQKVEQYRARAAFVAEPRSAASADAFLATIGMAPRLIDVGPATLARAAQLCRKTNQFNLRLARHDEADLAHILRQPGCIAFLVGLDDKFGDHGTVGLVVVASTCRPDVAFLDTFLLSCRALGRHLEAWMLEQLRHRLLGAGYDYLLAEFVPGERNAPSASFLQEHGFQSLADPSLGAERRTLAAEATVMTHPDRHYVAATQPWLIPHLEIFADEPPKTA